jgi:hypothetical protein
LALNACYHHPAMRRLVPLLAVLALLACDRSTTPTGGNAVAVPPRDGGPRLATPTPTPARPTACAVDDAHRERCREMVSHQVDLWQAETGRGPHEFRTFALVQCLAQTWPADVIACATAATDLEAFSACTEPVKALPLVQPTPGLSTAPPGPDGPDTSWYRDGEHPAFGVARKRAEGNLRDGRRHGPWTFWAPQGCLQISGAYRDGKRDGEWRRFDWQTGARTDLVQYRDGEQIAYQGETGVDEAFPPGLDD